ncbi:unnamed protein product, partial [Trichobilharzia szidati]
MLRIQLTRLCVTDSLKKDFSSLPLSLLLSRLLLYITWIISPMDCEHMTGVKKLRLQSLDIGSCLPEGDSFCTQRVQNSFCSTEKNECFCKSGYYSIQEDDGITCKTLLTNHKCQLDGDCKYVKNSICHPGAGACICPSGTIYVPQEHACRIYINQYSNNFCMKCKSYHGVCYLIENEKGSMHNKSIQPNRQNEKPRYGCKCPHNTMTINNNLLVKKNSLIIPSFQKLQDSKLEQVSDETDLSSELDKQSDNFMCRGLL